MDFGKSHFDIKYVFVVVDVVIIQKCFFVSHLWPKNEYFVISTR